MGVSYNRNVSLVLDANLTLLIIDVGISVRTQSYSNPCLKWDTGFLRPASEVEHRAAQTCTWNGTPGYSDPCKMRSSSDSRKPCHAPLPKIRENGVTTRVGAVYTRGKYPRIYAKPK